MAMKKDKRRPDVIRCERCGEDYSVTYKRCPFCDGKAGSGGYSGEGGTGKGGKRVATNTRGGGYGRAMQPVQIIGLALSFILIIAAIYIVFTVVRPLLGEESSGSGSMYSSGESVSLSGQSSSQPDASVSLPDVSGSGDISVPVVPDPSVSTDVITPIVTATGITLSSQDFTLKADETSKLTATVAPAGCTDPVVWSSSNEAALTITQDGSVTNINQGTTQVTVTVTAQVGDVKATCLVRCKPGSTGKPASGTGTPAGGTTAVKPGATGVVTGTGTGLLIRSGPGKKYEAQATATNGTVVTILEETADGWYKINYSGDGGKTKTGYASKDFIRVD